MFYRKPKKDELSQEKSVADQLKIELQIKREILLQKTLKIVKEKPNAG